MFPNIEAERVRRKMSRQYLSEVLGVSLRTLSNWVNGKTEIPAAAIITMAKLFKCSTDYLLGLDEQKPA
ncbi:helix-turn-helix domain-containing protein [Anaeromassilibacillus senegalensis]|uniref:helix-turn-helix domain-containing protein n=1 Tax=Anaeromassilibacillus senegalensis TaxID=1673717 RepID=UPI00093B3E78|nr:helix-turn-helix transcriptional regulator [Anaeromassilibacillus senegalensis]